MKGKRKEELIYGEFQSQTWVHNSNLPFLDESSPLGPFHIHAKWNVLHIFTNIMPCGF